MTPLVLALPGNDALAAALAEGTGGEVGGLALRAFPDGETHVRIDTAVADRDVVLACTLQAPDARTIPLLLAAATARDLGAARVGLVAPYLAYLRQDTRFAPGEGVTARYYPRILATSVEWVITVDPHLHRLRSLAEVYPVPAVAVAAAPAIARWVADAVPDGVVVGPDVESAQWAGEVARRAGRPVVVLKKERLGDRSVRLTLPDDGPWRGGTPVVVDDIVSTAGTMAAVVRRLREAGSPPPVCVAVHTVLDDGADAVRAAGAARLVTCNTIPHPTNAIDIHPALAAAVRDILAR